MPIPVGARPGIGPAAATGTPLAVDDLRSFVTFVRNHPSDCGQRQVFVRIDGARRIALVYGESIEVEVRPGMHHFRIHNTLFWKHIRIGIEPGEHLECQIINSARWWTAGMAGVLGSAPLFLAVEIRSRL
ncbi:MAG TPA: hypothetical protein VFO19_03605 [Vicinamibacterales bacterium]|nr:hypothetical protein [Vicinamibacterales bacterium]